MLRSQALTALFNENTDTTAPAIFLSTLSGHLIGTSSATSTLPPPLLRKASILASNTFAQHAEQVPGLASNPVTTIEGGSTFSAARGSRVSSRGVPSRVSERAGSAAGNGSLVSGSGSGSGSGSASVSVSGSSVVRGPESVSSTRTWRGYASVQPLTVLGRCEWRQQQSYGNGSIGEGSNGMETAVRRLVVELPVGLRSSGTEDRSVSRICAVESIGQGLLLGVIGAEWEDSIVSEAKGEHDGQDEDGPGSTPSQSSSGSMYSKEHRAREKARLVRLLDVKTEALAEFVRGEFEGFRMPKVDL